MRLKIAILTHNALEHTQKCLGSLASSTLIEHHVFVLDNASTDGTPAWLSAQRSPNLDVALSETNLGVPGGRNRLLREILPRLSDDEFLVFLDNDVEVRAGWYKPYLKLFDENPHVGIAGATGHCVIIKSDCRELLPSPVGKPAPVDVVSGFCFWVRPSVVRLVGLFDDRLGKFWHEDDDYCIRTIMQGYQIFAVPDTPIVHHGHKSGAAEANGSLSDSTANQCYLVNKWRRLGCVDAHGRIIHVARRTQNFETELDENHCLPSVVPGTRRDASTNAR